MLRSIKKLVGYNVLAKDGKIGHVEDFYFNDEHWVIRYLIVDIGLWIFGKKVLISPVSFIGEPDWTNSIFPINLTKEQINNSPEISSDKPVSRQKEEEIAHYYSWPVYWSAEYPGIYAYTVHMEVLNKRDGDAKNVPEKENADIHLRSSNELKGYSIKGMDGDIGQIDDFIVDDMSWEIKYIVIDTKKFLPGKKVIINLSWINDISWIDSSIHVNMTMDEIKNSPEYNPSESVNRKYEEVLYDYYGRPKYWE